MMKRMALSLFLLSAGLVPVTRAQQPQTPPPAGTDDSGPQTDNGSIVLPKKKEDAPLPPAPAEEKLKNPNGEVYSMRVDVPIVNLDVSVILDKNHQFVPGLKAENFLVVEDGVEQQVQSLRTTKTPITAVMLLEFAANSYALIRDMQNASASFFRTLQPEDYVAVATYDMRTHILCDFTNNKDTIRGLAVAGAARLPGDQRVRRSVRDAGPADPRGGTQVHHPHRVRAGHHVPADPGQDAGQD
jgi:hypothetical protein